MRARSYKEGAVSTGRWNRRCKSRVPAREKVRKQRIACRNYAPEHDIDKPEMVEWRWPT
jgi:phosphoketolase